jgi:23S rRNA A2030 N6-methylase RlmJ
VLSCTEYVRTLDDLIGHSNDHARYPGSALLALRMPGAAKRRYLFCDVDGGSIASIRQAAAQEHVDPTSVQTINGDGIDACRQATEQCAQATRQRTLLLVDPFRISEPNAQGWTSADLFAHASSRGVMAVLWYCARTREETESVRGVIAQLVTRVEDDECAAWRGEIACAALDEPTFAAPGVGMCGLLCANLPDTALRRLGALGEALADLYADATLPNGTGGALCYTQSTGTVPVTG